MARELSLRKVCAECRRNFFTQDRKEKFCSRCAGKVAERKEGEKKTRQREKEKVRPPQKTPVAAPRFQDIFSEDLKGQILREYESYRDQKEVPWRKIHGLMAKKLRVKKMLVAQLLRPLEVKFVLTEEMEREVINRYRGYVERMERPPRGRRKTIASEMGIPYRSVAAAVREWKHRQPPIKDLSREQRFSIEKTYFALLQKRRSLSRIKDKIVKETGFSPWQVSYYLDQLHDGEGPLRKVPDVSPADREKILAGYSEYLSAPAPPGPFLHTLLAERAGVTHRQVHKVLLNYRLALLRKVQQQADL